MFKFPTFAASVILVLVVLLVSTWLPLADDYDALLQFLVSFNQSNSWQERFNLLTTPHNEHLIFIPRLIALLMTEIHTYDSRIMILMALAALGVSAFLLRGLNRSKNVALSSAATLIVFAPHPFEAWTWSLAALQYSIVILAALGASILVFAERSLEKKINIRTIAAILLVLLAVGSQASGPIIPLCILGVSLSQRKPSLPWLIIAPLSLLPILLTFSIPTASDELPNLLSVIGYFLYILGSGFIQFGEVSGLLMGGAILAVYLRALTKGVYQKYPALLSFFSFLILSALAISISRSSLNENLFSMPHRYTILGLFTFASACLSLDLLVKAERRPAVGNLAFLAALLSVGSGWLTYYTDYLQRWQFKIDSELSMSLGAFPPLHPLPKHAEAIFNKAKDLEIVNVRDLVEVRKPTPLLTVEEACPSSIELAQDPRSKDGAGKVVWESFHYSNDTLFGSGYAIPPHGTCKKCEYLIGLYDGEKYLIAKTSQRIRQDVVKTYGDLATSLPGFMVFADTSKVSLGQYEVRPIWKAKGKCFTRKTKTTIQK